MLPKNPENQKLKNSSKYILEGIFTTFEKTNRGRIYPAPTKYIRMIAIKYLLGI